MIGSSPKNLEKCGKLLYGQNWKRQLARTLGIKNPTRIKDWLNSRYDIPEGVWADVIALLKQRNIDIKRVLREIE